MVNRDAQRFYDEGEDFWPKRYAIWGRLVAQQPGEIAYILFDAKSLATGVFPLDRTREAFEAAAYRTTVASVVSFV